MKKYSPSLDEWLAKRLADPKYQAFQARLERLAAEGWKPIYEGAPTDGKTEIIAMCDDDVERRGILVPYWCGSDCPCVDPQDSTAQTMYDIFGEENCAPKCWTLKDVEPLATHWKPI